MTSSLPATDLRVVLAGSSRPRQRRGHSRGTPASKVQSRRRNSDASTAQTVERLEAFFGQPRPAEDEVQMSESASLVAPPAAQREAAGRQEAAAPGPSAALPGRLSHLSDLTTAQLRNLQTAASQAAARLPQWELEVPTLPQLPSLPQLPAPRLPRLPTALPKLPSPPSLELPRLDLELEGWDPVAVRQGLEQLQRLSAQQVAHLREAAARVARRAQRTEQGQQQQAVQGPKEQQAEQRQAEPAARQEAHAPPAQPAALPPPQQHQQHGAEVAAQTGPQQVATVVAQQEAEAGPSASAATLEPPCRQEMVGQAVASWREAVQISAPPMPPLGIKDWRQGGLTAWAWGLLALLAAMVLSAVWAILGRWRHAAQQAVRDAEQRARQAQRMERQRRRFRRALLAAEDFEGASADSSVFTSVSKKRGSPGLEPPQPVSPNSEGAAPGQEGQASLSEGQGRALSASFRPSSSSAAAAAGAAEVVVGAAAAGAASAAAPEDNPFLRGMAPGASFSMDEEGGEGAAWDDVDGTGAPDSSAGADSDVYDPDSWDEQTRRAWDSFVASSKVGQGRLWDVGDVDEGLPATHVDLDKD